MKQKPSSPSSLPSGQIEFIRSNDTQWGGRDLYRMVLALSWPRFLLMSLAVYVLVNSAFAGLYLLGGDCISGMEPRSFSGAFFFSVQTLSTVGYGHWYPTTLYGDLLTTVEIVVGLFLTAVVTGLVFVRFSRPMARLMFSDRMVIRSFDGTPSLQFRVANLQRQAMVEAEFRLLMVRKESVPEEDDIRRFYDLKLEISRMVMLPHALTIRHRIDETSPLAGVTRELLEQGKLRFMASMVCIDTVIQSPVQSQKHYIWNDVHFDHRFVEIYNELEEGRMEVNYGRFHEIEPDPHR